MIDAIKAIVGTAIIVLGLVFIAGLLIYPFAKHEHGLMKACMADGNPEYRCYGIIYGRR